MSSAGFETELLPSERARLGLLLLAGGATSVGTMLILAMPTLPALKLVLAVVWIFSGVAELGCLRKGMSRIDRIRIRADGRVDGIGRNERQYAISLLPGSVVLDRVAWLRLHFADGLRYGELVTRKAGESEQWRRLLVIWRQQAVVGRLPRS